MRIFVQAVAVVLTILLLVFRHNHVSARVYYKRSGQQHQCLSTASFNPYLLLQSLTCPADHAVPPRNKRDPESYLDNEQMDQTN